MSEKLLEVNLKDSEMEVYTLEQIRVSHILPNGEAIDICHTGFEDSANENGYELILNDGIHAKNLTTNVIKQIQSIDELEAVLGCAIWELTDGDCTAFRTYDLLSHGCPEYFFCNDGKNTVYVIAEEESTISGAYLQQDDFLQDALEKLNISEKDVIFNNDKVVVFRKN